MLFVLIRMLMRTHNIPFSIYRGKHSLNYLNSAAVGFFQGTLERVRNSRGRRAISARAIEVLLYIFREKDEKIYWRANYVSHLKACHTQEVSSKSAFDFCYFDVFLASYCIFLACLLSDLLKLLRCLFIVLILSHVTLFFSIISTAKTDVPKYALVCHFILASFEFCKASCLDHWNRMPGMELNEFSNVFPVVCFGLNVALN